MTRPPVTAADLSVEPSTDLLAAQLAALRGRLRPGQQAIADWSGGRLAVSAVPGAGKSTGMAAAAAITIARHQLHSRKQLVVVTFTRSAAHQLKTKIRQHLEDLGLPPIGFVVQTLHGLALTIGRSDASRSGLDPDAILTTTTQSHRLIRVSVEQWIAAHPNLYGYLLAGQQFDGETTERLRRQSVLRTEVLPALAQTVIHEAKSSGLSPDDLLAQNDQINHSGADNYQTLALAAGLYEQYQIQLRARNWLDYDEMILGALRVLADPSLRQRWQTQVFAVFEDEAQDSSPLQTRLLEILAADPAAPDDPARQNLVRVGDPNQAINSTFTPADPSFFREFCTDCADHGRLTEMLQAGRSSPIIIQAANYMLDWVNAWVAQRGDRLPDPELPPELPFRHQLIQPVPPQDPQANANPAPEGQGLELYRPEDTFQTVDLIGQRAAALFAANPDTTAAILVRTNEQGRFLVRELQRLQTLNLFEVGARDRQSQIPAEMLALLQFLHRPHSPDSLKAALTTLMNRRKIASQDLNALTAQPEQFLYPTPLDPMPADVVQQARRYCTSLLRARMELPLNQLMPFLAFTLGYEQTELATADKLADRLAQQLPENSLEALLAALAEIVSSEQFEPVDAEDRDDRYTRPGQLTIITLHKSKGLDWDVVFIPFLHENMIPGTPWVPQQAQFLGDFKLDQVARAQIRNRIHGQAALSSSRRKSSACSMWA
jgi:DNA helicase II / ATP-dependent DNA helicase PcrA